MWRRLTARSTPVAACLLVAAFAFSAVAAADSTQPGSIVTVAQLAHPRGLALLADGDVLVPEPFAHDVRLVAPDGTSTVVAGTGVAGSSGDGGPAIDAELNLPHGVALLPDGSFVIADALVNRIRRVAPDGTITSVVGNGEHAFAGDGGPATAASIASPRGIASLSDGTLLIPDTDNERVREVTPAGTITTVAGTGVVGDAGDGGPAVAAQLDQPFGVSPLPGGGFLIAEAHGSRIRKVDATGTITTVAGTGTVGFTGDGGPATAAELADPHAVLALPSGGFLITDTFNNRVRRVWPDGTITTVAGTGAAGFSGDGPATQESLDQPKALALLPDGRVLVADAANDRLRVLTPTRPAASRIVSMTVTGHATLSVRFRVCDGTRDTLRAEVRLTGKGPGRVVAVALPSTRGGCLPFRLQVARGGASLVRLRVRNDSGLWSLAARQTLRHA